MSITLLEAEQIIRAAKEKAADMGIAVAITVLDAHSDLVAVARMDGVRWTASDISQGKAFAAATFRRSSGEVGERSDTPFFRSVLLMYAGRIVASQGGVPIRRGEEVVGGVGVSGGTGQEDEEIAQAGIDALG